MSAFDALATLITLAAVFSWVNHRWVRLPTTIGLMLISMLASLALVGLGEAGLPGRGDLPQLLASVEFDRALLDGMLGALLFAGALHVNVNDLAARKLVIGLLATAGVCLSTLIVAFVSRAVFGLVGFDIPLVDALLFGALISPTDPIAVSAILRRAGVPPSLETKITGESLFNDGVGVVVFLLILGIAGGGHAVEPAAVARLFAVEVLGGLAFGGLVGWIAFRMLKSVDQYAVEILITLAIVTGGYALAHHLHTSGPLAMVVAGLFIGNRGRALAMSAATRERLDSFWELADEFLNAVLFVMIGIEVVVLEFAGPVLAAGLLAIPIVLAARWASVGLPVTCLRPWRGFSPHAVKILTWSGLRGGISVALALSLPAGPSRSLIITVTYVVVAFSIVVQGLTVGPVARRLAGGIAWTPPARPAYAHGPESPPEEESG
ncbi:MAG: cation:proton antiporter [Gemmatimonadota bacterium]